MNAGWLSLQIGSMLVAIPCTPGISSVLVTQFAVPINRVLRSAHCKSAEALPHEPKVALIYQSNSLFTQLICTASLCFPLLLPAPVVPRGRRPSALPRARGGVLPPRLGGPECTATPALQRPVRRGAGPAGERAVARGVTSERGGRGLQHCLNADAIAE